MALAFAFSAEQGLCAAEDAARVAAHLRDVGLPDGLATANVDTDGETLVAHMLHDKKMDAGTLPFLLARGIGQTYLDRSVDPGAVAAFLNAARGCSGGRPPGAARGGSEEGRVGNEEVETCSAWGAPDP